MRTAPPIEDGIPKIGSRPESPARAAAGGQPLSFDRDPEEVAFEPNDPARESLVGGEDVRAHAQKRERLADVRGGAKDPGKALLRSDPAVPAGRTADPQSGVARKELSFENRAVAGGELQAHAGRTATKAATPDVTPAARTPAATSSTMIPQPPGRFCQDRIGPGFHTSKSRKARKEAIHTRVATRGDGYSKRGTMPHARNCPAISSKTMQPGSLRRSAASARSATGTPARETRSPDVNSPTAATTLGM